MGKIPMKRRWMILMSLFVLSTVISSAQKVNLNFSQTNLRTVLESITQQTDYTLAFSKEVVDLNDAVTIRVTDTDLTQVLDQLFTPRNIGYELRDNKIYIFDKSTAATSETTQAPQQEIRLSGRVTDENDDPVIGANISVPETTIGTVTDIDGNYALSVPRGATLRVSYIGYLEQQFTITNQTVLNVQLQEDTEVLDELVVIGYGVQRKSVVTAAISRVTADDLAFTAPVRVDNALKGLTAGVTVTSASGQPGDAAKVRVRGIGTINNSNPVYIVDGMPIDGGIDYLNPSDIESIEVLKDAASGAIYGTRAANGVILVTTKKGKEGKVSFTYDFSYGMQSPWKERDVLNATEYAILMNEGRINGGNSPFYADPYSFGEGTNWQKEVFNYNAPLVQHQFSASGTTQRLNYYLSAGYYSQEGIVGGNFDRSNYKRLALRSNNTYVLMDAKNERNWLSNVTFGANLAYSRIQSQGITTNSEYGSPLGSALAFSPILGIYEEDEDAVFERYANVTNFSPVRDKNNGRIYTIAGSDYNEIVNPLATLTLPGEKGNADKFIANFWGELTIWDNLKFRSSFGTDLAFWGTDGWTPVYYLGQSNKAEKSSVWSEMNRSLVWQLENTLSYDKAIGLHNVTVLLGQSAKKTNGRQLGGSNYYMVEENPNKANINFTTGTAANGDMSVYGGATNPHALASYFARLSYNYAERYMFQATIRRDGSSRFGTNNPWATFPSFSLGWNIMNEEFAQNRPDWLNSTKLRFSWGKNGNENLDDFRYVALTQTGNNYFFGTGDAIRLLNGTKPNGLANRDLRWEQSIQTNIGIDFGLLGNALTFSGDYYKKITDGMLMVMPIPSYVGESKPWGNVGEMENSGFEFETSYRFKVSDFNFRIGGNATYLKNKLIKLGNETGFENYDNYQNVGTVSRAENGQPFPFFYGYKTNGIFQNLDEINSYTHTDADGNVSLIQPKAVPGDVRFVDINGDGKIDDNDKTKIGKGMPDWTFGLNFSVAWKNFDFNMMWQGTQGNDIFDATRRTDIAYINLPSYMLDRWTGEGTSNRIPRFTFTDDNNNWLSSDLYVKDGSYWRLKNIQLGYTLPRGMTKNLLISSLRLFVAAENLLTLTKYEGFDPEISAGGTQIGIDRGIYPQARTYTFGLNLNF
ncbi:TonB-dependent receptor [Proteiniphilum acetatigenes]|uniref:TonB-dependent receptor n=1 Tax=Proteiniphilum acetatigenes TaxID=294710 RepID=UPI001FE0E823|nr:TonB-dependent receptor [Proteiniphilum acetatigenes]